LFADFDLWKDGNCVLCDEQDEWEEDEEEEENVEDVEVVNKEKSSMLALVDILLVIFDKSFDEEDFLSFVEWNIFSNFDDNLLHDPNEYLGSFLWPFFPCKNNSICKFHQVTMINLLIWSSAQYRVPTRMSHN